MNIIQFTSQQGKQQNVIPKHDFVRINTLYKKVTGILPQTTKHIKHVLINNQVKSKQNIIGYNK